MRAVITSRFGSTRRISKPRRSRSTGAGARLRSIEARTSIALRVLCASLAQQQRQCVARVSRCRDSAQATMKSRRDPHAETSDVSHDTVRAGAVSEETGTGASRAPPLLPSENHFARARRAVSRPRPPRADTPTLLTNARRSSATRSRNPCRRAMSCRTGACARSCPSSWRRRRRRCVPARIVRPAPRTARSGRSRPERPGDRARLGSATRDDDASGDVFGIARARELVRPSR